MKGKILLLFVFSMVVITASSCGSETPPSITFKSEKQTIEPMDTPEPFVIGACDPAAELIEMNKSYNKGVGCGYTDLESHCGMYCLWVPEGSQLKINITDSFSDLKLIVQRDLSEDPDSAGSWVSDNIGRALDESVTIENPEGRYYIMVCPKGGQSCSFQGNAVVFTSAALFTLNSEFKGDPSQPASRVADSPPVVIPSAGINQPGSLTVRTGPGWQYIPAESQLPLGSGAALVGRTADGNWLLVEFGSTQGWVPASEASVSGSYSLAPVIETAPPPTSTPEPCPRRIAESILEDQGFQYLRAELYELVAAADGKQPEDLAPILSQMEELLEKIDGFSFSPPWSSCADSVHTALYNYAFEVEQCYSLKFAEVADGVDDTVNIEFWCSSAESSGDAFELLIKELEQIINPIPTTTPPATPQKTSAYTNDLYDPNLEISDVEVTGNRINLTICFEPPSDRADWMMGRLHGDVYIDDGTHKVILSRFTLESPYNISGSSAQPRCYRSGSSKPGDFQIDQATLTVERIAATIGSKVDWDAVLEKIGLVAPGIVIDPILDQPGPGFAVIETPPGMTALEAHNIVMGLMEPVVIGPWSIPIQVDLE